MDFLYLKELWSYFFLFFLKVGELVGLESKYDEVWVWVSLE